MYLLIIMVTTYFQVTMIATFTSCSVVTSINHSYPVTGININYTDTSDNGAYININSNSNYAVTCNNNKNDNNTEIYIPLYPQSPLCISFILWTYLHYGYLHCNDYHLVLGYELKRHYDQCLHLRNIQRIKKHFIIGRTKNRSRNRKYKVDLCAFFFRSIEIFNKIMTIAHVTIR